MSDEIHDEERATIDAVSNIRNQAAVHRDGYEKDKWFPKIEET